eukprot:gb/GFBE01001333.1/.p1 GENE.gb/GFBE01001333.1/~~gb/GFBE01001333.1/.p1  ORF type:complete len:400 (+),score=101.86 gb/GFBE01001333.1/:1-1200(+)
MQQTVAAMSVRAKPTQDGCLHSAESIERELLRSNRELAQVRDQLCQKENLVQEWHNRYLESTSRLKEAQGELSKAQAQLTELDESRCSPSSCSLAADELEARLQEEIQARQDAEARLLQEIQAREDAEAGLLAMVQARQVAEAEQLAEMQARQAAEDSLQAETQARHVVEAKLDEESQARRQLEVAVLQAREEAEAAVGSSYAALPAEVDRLKSLLTSERSARVAAEAHAKTTAAERETLAKQVRRITEELRQRKAAAAAAATAAAAAAWRSSQPCCEIEAQLEKLQARARILQVENTAMRADASGHRRRLQEAREAQTMAAEEIRSRSAEAARARAEAAKFKLLLEETRRARQVEMTSFVKKMCGAGAPPPVRSSAGSCLAGQGAPQSVLTISRVGGT